MGVFEDIAGTQVAAVAAAAGFSGPDLVTIVAIAKGESGWRSDNVNDGPGETPPSQKANRPCASFGLWQINYCPDRDANNANRGAGNPNVLLDPLTNARSAFALYSGRPAGAKFADWTVYNSGAWQKHEGAARKAVESLNTDNGKRVLESAKAGGIKNINPGDGGIGWSDVPGVAWDVVTNPDDVARAAWELGPGQFTDWMGALKALVEFIVNPRNWLRLLGAWLGASMVIGGIVLLALDTTGTADDAVRVGIGAATKGPAGAAIAAQA